MITDCNDVFVVALPLMLYVVIFSPLILPAKQPNPFHHRLIPDIRHRNVYHGSVHLFLFTLDRYKIFL